VIVSIKVVSKQCCFVQEEGTALDSGEGGTCAPTPASTAREIFQETARAWDQENGAVEGDWHGSEDNNRN